MIAALYDVHGNLPALEAVLDDVRAAGAALIVLGGDVTPGPLVPECLEAIRSAGIPWLGLRGNGDNDVLSARLGTMPDRVPEGVHGVLRWCATALSDRDADEIGRWAPTRLVERPAGDVLFCHATPRDDNEIFTEETPAERVAPVLEGVDAEVVVCGHTHMPFDRRVGSVRIVNAGSVGMPFGATGAQWLAVHDDRIEPRVTEYDIAAAQLRLDASGYPFPLDLASPPSREGMLEAFAAVAV